jgi:electron transport complex protein RnfE
MNEYRKIFHNGLWKNNQALVAMLGLCPLLAVSNTTINALGLGVATLLVLTFSNVVISLTRNYIKPEIRIPLFVLIIASTVTIIEILMQAYFYNLYQILGIFVPLIVTNCAILGRAEAFASKHNLLKSTLDGLSMGLGFMLVLVVLGFLRELIGSGTIFAGSELIFNTDMSLTIFNTQTILAILPPGAFIVLALMVAFKNYVDTRLSS